MSYRDAVIGGGFTALWGAGRAARARALFAIPEDDVEIARWQGPRKNAGP